MSEIESSFGGVMAREAPKLGEFYIFDGYAVRVTDVLKKKHYRVSFTYDNDTAAPIQTVGGKEWFAKAVRV